MIGHSNKRVKEAITDLAVAMRSYVPPEHWSDMESCLVNWFNSQFEIYGAQTLIGPYEARREDINEIKYAKTRKLAHDMAEHLYKHSAIHREIPIDDGLSGILSEPNVDPGFHRMTEPEREVLAIEMFALRREKR